MILGVLSFPLESLQEHPKYRILQQSKRSAGLIRAEVTLEVALAQPRMGRAWVLVAGPSPKGKEDSGTGPLACW